ncbi:hypothetical protein Syun_006804 [Stephania yunnanensis]|uniref:Uncharacterized protein n=1 Tax=Stephania yunnanensis TaxID=152371 RepID=A0AAP0PY00_9MAGN
MGDKRSDKVELVMVEVDQNERPLSAPIPMSTKKKQLLTTAMKRTSEWFAFLLFFCFMYSSMEVSPLTGASDADLAVIGVLDISGGDEAFELATKFCYGINFEISIDNIAMLCCAAEYL